MTDRLFVYGTLAPGRPNQHVLAGVPGDWVPASVRGTLLHEGWGALVGYTGIAICRRYGALWALYAPEVVDLVGRPEQMAAYVWGQRSIRTMRCSTCGCVTHWEPIIPEAGTRLGINMRNFDPHVTAGIKVRKFDGADTWAYIE